MIPFLTTLTLAQTSIMPRDGNENMAVSLALAALAFLVTIVMGRPIITYLRQRKVGKKIRLELEQHFGKAGTPTMGGIMIIITVVVLTFVFNTVGRLSMLLPIAVLVSTGVLGGIDDAMNLVGGKQGGMSGRVKMLWLILIGLGAALVLHLPDPYGLDLRHIYVPFVGRFDVGWIYVPIAAFAIVAMANAVNLTDGLDTLAAGTAAVAFVAW
jgi:phospho-N-acetylmuramoyl-pentapeptide-transferase